MKVAIIGSGIAGLSCAYHLDKSGHETTIFEKNNYFGGHTDTHSLEIGDQTVAIDSGFIVFAREFYPNFCTMLDELGINSKPTDMSFSCSNAETNIIYSATNLDTLFAQRKNLLSISFYRMLFDLVRFYRSADAILNNVDNTLTCGEFFKQKHYSKSFQDNHIFPMISALWSTPVGLVKKYPIRYLVEYMQAHGMMKLFNRPTWQVLTNGSNEYIEKLKSHLQHSTWKLNCGVTNVIREQDRVLIHSSSSENEYFDAVVMACHSDQAKIILHKPSSTENEILSAIGFEPNEVTVHTDESIMPALKKTWASWNSHASINPAQPCTATYWMNSLQGLDIQQDVFVSLNETRNIASEKILAKRSYHHPSYTAKSVEARLRIDEINGQNRTAYAGAYWGWAFHEDGARTGLNAAKAIIENYG
jgi:predicted NAD/FAD-binding protein